MREGKKLSKIPILQKKDSNFKISNPLKIRKNATQDIAKALR